MPTLPLAVPASCTQTASTRPLPARPSLATTPSRPTRPRSPPAPAPADKKSDLPPVYYTISSILNLFSFPDLWKDAVWATPQKLLQIRDAMKAYIQGCEAYTGGGLPRVPPPAS